jgi:aminoglycoside phosphotransferase (APT) family kinase protein
VAVPCLRCWPARRRAQQWPIGAVGIADENRPVAENRTPSVDDVRRILSATLPASVAKLERFNTGNHHFVYDVQLADGSTVVVRIAHPEEKAAIQGALYWSQVLKPRGVPLPDVRAADVTCTHARFPYMILERLPGTDLGRVYKELSVPQRRAIIARLIEIQQAATTLPQGRGFGYAASMDGPFRYRSWKAFIADRISLTRSRIARAGHFSAEVIGRLEQRSEELADYFDTVGPTPFLHDMTSKNVLVDGGRLTGIVDVDSLCFGDPLYLPGLIQAAFLADGLDADYIADWTEALSADAQQKRVIEFYALQCLSCIMGEAGLRQNRPEQKGPTADDRAHLNACVSALLQKM